MSPLAAPAVGVVPADLAASIRAHRTHLFVGSGVSASAGLLGWADLMEEMTGVIRKENVVYAPGDLEDFLAHADYLDIAEVFRETVGPNTYFRFLRENYRRDVPLSALLKALAKLELTTIYTTNYDKLLEIAFRRTAKIDPTVVIYPDQLNCIGEDEVRIVKLHGDVDHPTSIVLTRRDYASYSSRHREFVRALESSIIGSTMLFVGFSLRDSNFLRIYNDARSFFDSVGRQSYAFMTDTNIVERSLWKDEGLTIIPVPTHKHMAAKVSALCVSRGSV
jgi:hypothetical protein